MPDQISEVSLLTRRELEARIVGPLLEKFAEEFGSKRTYELTREVIEGLALKAGQELAKSAGGTNMKDFASALEPFSEDGANELDVLELTDDSYNINMTRCKYAEMYKRLGMIELGQILSCSRDFALCQGFNPEISLTRTQTIMEGAEFCDFKFKLNTNNE